MEQLIDEIKKEPKKVAPGKIKKLWDSGQAYKNQLGLLNKWVTNDKFVAGEQWASFPQNAKHLLQMPKPVLNICRQIVNFKTAAVKAENVKMVFSSFGTGASEAPAMGEEVKDIGDLLTKMTEVTWEKARMDSIAARAVDRACMTGIGITYFYWDKSVKGSFNGKNYIGDIRAEAIDAMYVVFGNPQELDVQKQPYIIVSGRMTVEEARRIAEVNGTSKTDIELIKGDETAESERYTGATHEDTETDKVTVHTLFRKEKGTVWYTRTTDAVVLEPMKDLKLKQYPFAIFNWEERMDCIYGNDEVGSIIPNQKLINGLLAMDAMSKQLTGFPKLFVDTRYVDTRLMTNIPGEIVRSTSKNLPTGHVPMQYIQPAQQTNAVQSLVDMISQKTKDIAGANEAITGEANTNNASAIMLLQKSSGLPNEDIRRRYYQYIEDIGGILIDFYKTYYTLERAMQYKTMSGDYGTVDFSSKLLDGVDFTIRSDIGASSVFGDSNAVSTLDKLMQLQAIDKVTYVKLLPKGVAPFKEELLAIYKLEAELRMKMQQEQAMQEQAMAMQAQRPSIEAEMAGVAEPSQPEAPQRLRLQEEYGSNRE